MSTERERVGAIALRYGYIGVDRDNIVDIVLEAMAGPLAEIERLKLALIEAQNPGIDMDEVRSSRGALAARLHDLPNPADQPLGREGRH